MKINVKSIKVPPLIIFFLLLFFINSFYSVVVFSIYAIRKRESFSNYFAWGFLFALFISVFNASKVPTNDLAMYIDYYRLAEYIPLNKYIYILGNWGKDIFYLGYTWIIHAIIGNTDRLFVFLLSLTSYLFFLKTVLIACKSLNLNTTSVFLCFAVLFFHPYIFSTSAHILRQTIAFSIMAYVLAKKIFEQKNYWYLGIAAALFHGSVLFFLPFLFLNILYEPITFKKLLVIGCLAGAGVSINRILFYLQAIGLPISFFNFAIQRAANGTTFNSSLDLKQMILSFTLVSIMFFLVYVKKKSLKKDLSYNYFLNLTMILLFFILINKESGELQHRFNIFFWQLHPIFAAFFLAAYKRLESLTKILISLLFFISWFLYNSMFSPWTYECSDFFWLYPAFMYFI